MNNTIWKLGCNWGSGKPSFYNFIKNNEIVIGVHDKRYSVGDYILVTEGFTAKAIVRITSKHTPVTQREELEKDFKELKIDFEDWVEFYQGSWYELEKDETFEYKQERGIVRIRKEEIIDTMLEIVEKLEIQKLKKTEYFSHLGAWNQYELWINNLIEKRDKFIKDNIKNIGRIEDEDILITNVANANIIAIIKLTYYPK